MILNQHKFHSMIDMPDLAEFITTPSTTRCIDDVFSARSRYAGQ